jgi:hypothetical protein
VPNLGRCLETPVGRPWLAPKRERKTMNIITVILEVLGQLTSYVQLFTVLLDILRAIGLPV